MHLKVLMRLDKKYKQTILGLVLICVLVWGIVILGGTYLDIPYQYAASNAPNPWQPIPYQTYPQGRIFSIDFVDSTHGWVGAASGKVYATTDGGKTWTSQFTGSSGTLEKIDFVNQYVGAAIADWKTDHILITQTGGANWTVIELNEASPRDIIVTDEQTAWVLGSGARIFHINLLTNDLTLIAHHSSMYLARIFMLNNSYGWAAGNGRIIHTQDAWQTYEQQESGFSKDFTSMFFWDTKIGWLTGFDRTILGTVDGGAHWSIQYSAPHPFGLTLISDIFFLTRFQGWAVGGSGIYYTENGGQHWHVLPNTGKPDSITFANHTHGWAISNINKERGRITTVGGYISINEQQITQNYAIFSFLGILGIGVIVIVGITLYYRQRKQRVLQSQSKLTSNFPKSEPPCDHSLSHQTNFCIHCGAKLSPPKD